MKRSFKCYIACLTLLGLVAPLFLTSLDVNALKHEYKGLPLINAINPLTQDSSHNYFDWTSSSFSGVSLGGTGFDLWFENDAWRDNYNDLKVKSELRSFSANLSNNQCNYSDMFSEYVVRKNWSLKNDTMTQQSPYLGIGESHYEDRGFGANYYVPDYWIIDSCYSINGMINFNRDSADHFISGPYPSTPNPTTFASHANGGYYNPLDLMEDDKMLPRTFTQGQVNYESTFKDTGNGVVYKKTLSFDKIFNQNIQSFSYFRMGLWDTSGYWTNDTNLWSGRQIDFHFNFRFYNNVEISQNFQQNGKIQILATVIPKNVEQNPTYYKYYDCTSQFREVQLETGNAYYWDITCPITLDQDYIAFVPNLIVNGQGYNVMNINSSWDFSSLYVVTDNDDTQGDNFNEDSRFINNDKIWDDYWDDQDTDNGSGDEDWFESLVTMFNFGLINPFAPMFEMFSDSTTCAQIPILAGMIHSQETQVCPWFSSGTRAVLTPVFSISSMMLLFGFFVRWLKSNSDASIQAEGGKL